MAYVRQGASLKGLELNIRSLVSQKEILKITKRSVLILDREIRNSTKKSVKKRTGEDAWKRPTGQLMRNWSKFFKVKNGGETVVFGSLNELPYASIHETGGTIKAKKKYLAIPLDKKVRGAWPSSFPKGLFQFGFSEKGNAFLFLGQSKQKKKEYQKKYREKKKRQRQQRKRDRSIGLSGVRGLLGVRGAKRGEAMTRFKAGTSKDWQKWATSSRRTDVLT